MISKSEVERFHEERRLKGPLFQATLGGKKFLYVGRSASLKELTKANNNNFRIFNQPHIHRLFGRPIFSLEGEEHASRRKLWRKALGNAEIEHLGPCISSIVCQTLDRYVSSICNLEDCVTTIMNRICIECILGIRSKPVSFLFNFCYEMFRKAQSTSSDELTLSARIRLAKGIAASRILRIVFRTKIRSSLKGRDASQSILTLMLRSGRKHILAEIADDLLAFIVASRDTTSSAINWLVVELAQRPELQVALRNECNVLIKSMCPLGMHNFREIPLTYAFLQEVLRLHSPNILATKEAKIDVEIGGHFIQRGEHIVYSPLFEHFDSTSLGCPHEFQEDRFLRLKKPYNLLSFGLGAHSCLGRPFAETLLVSVLINLVSKYNVDILTDSISDYAYTSSGKKFTKKVSLCITPL